MSCGVGHRFALDPTLLWLWHRPAAVAQTRPLAWELPYAKSVVPTAKKKQKQKQKNSQGSHWGSAETNPTSIHEDAGLIPGLTQ